METQSSHDAAIPNPALSPLKKLIGEWKTVGTHPYLPGITFHGHASFKWIEGGAFLIMHTEIDEEGIPSGISLFGSDDATEEYFMLYFDERKVSRKYEVSFRNKVLRWWRNAPNFSQRCTLTLDGNDTIVAKGEMCKDGKTWEKDLEQTFTRIT